MNEREERDEEMKIMALKAKVKQQKLERAQKKMYKTKIASYYLRRGEEK